MRSGAHFGLCLQFLNPNWFGGKKTLTDTIKDCADDKDDVDNVDVEE